MLASKTYTVKQSGSVPAKTDQVVTAVRAWPEHCIHHAKLLKRQAKAGGGERWRVCADDERPRMLTEKGRKSTLKPSAQILATL